MLYFVRHAKAGSRNKWVGDDRLRPLTDAGHDQARAIDKQLASLAAGGRIVSSPYVRCVQTVEPLAARLGVTVETDERLAEGMDFADALELIGELPEGSVLCSHGDVIPDTIEALERRGCRFVGEPDWRKGSTWVLTREGGEIVSAQAWPPPGE
jgi:8-oxo-dGTP diphosphatase